MFNSKKSRTLKLTFSLLIVIQLISNNISAQSTKFYSVTTSSGSHDSGVLFMTDGDGNNYQELKSFTYNPGKRSGYVKFCEANNGKLYGTFAEGFEGGIDGGLIFELDPKNNKYEVKYTFKDSANYFNNGRMPYSGLIKAQNGILYGVTPDGGKYNFGVLYSYNPTTEIYKKLHDFDSINGSSPYGRLMQASNGVLYGMASKGGSYDAGVIYKYNINSLTFKKLINLGGALGKYPIGSLCEADNGKLYGTTPEGGSNGQGLIFSFDIKNETYDRIRSFTSGPYGIGYSPRGGFIKFSPNRLIGLCALGGDNRDGVIFELNTKNNNCIARHHFKEAIDGKWPDGELLLANDGNIYGSTKYGGNKGAGVYFKMDTSIFKFTIIKDFELQELGFRFPNGSLMQGSDGKIYGNIDKKTSSNHQHESIYSYSINQNKFEEKVWLGNGSDGYYPIGSLLKASNGRYYGITNEGGKHSFGVLYEYNLTNNLYTVKVNFTRNIGQGICTDLMEASNGKLYGVSRYGGSNEQGLIFEYDYVLDTLIRKIDFSNHNNVGFFPYSKLIEGSNGKLYGTTYNNGYSGSAILYEYDPKTNTIIKKLDFKNYLLDGVSGMNFLRIGDKLYNVGTKIGAKSQGSVITYDVVTNTLNTVDSFTNITGIYPSTSLINGYNGKIYGSTLRGGKNDVGTVFEYNINTKKIRKLVDLDENNIGNSLYGKFLLATNGNLYGFTSQIGKLGFNMIEVNIKTKTAAIKHFFPARTTILIPFNLIEIDCNPLPDTLKVISCSPYTLPSGRATISNKGTYFIPDTIKNPCDSTIALVINLKIIDIKKNSIEGDGNILTSNLIATKYKWLDCNNNYSPIPEATSREFKVKNVGSYAIAISTGNCVDTSDCYEVTIADLQNESFSENYKVYPNPTTNNLIIERNSNNRDKTSYSLFNSMGQMINSGQFNKLKFKLQLNGNNGIYYLEIKDNHYKKVIKIIKLKSAFE